MFRHIWPKDLFRSRIIEWSAWGFQKDVLKICGFFAPLQPHPEPIYALNWHNLRYYICFSETPPPKCDRHIWKDLISATINCLWHLCYKSNPPEWIAHVLFTHKSGALCCRKISVVAAPLNYEDVGRSFNPHSSRDQWPRRQHPDNRCKYEVSQLRTGCYSRSRTCWDTL